MEKNIKYLIVPDVHGRAFWKSPVMQTLQSPVMTDVHIVFLGDYHDPYPQDFDYDEDYLKKSVDNFKEIIDIKRKYPDRVTLLIGNHDCGYAISEYICSSRMDRWHRRELEKIFQENRELFQIAAECDIAGRHIVFSHAGILKGWADHVWGGEETSSPEFNIVEELNKAWSENHYGILDALGIYDGYRGFGGATYGSPVWSDIRAWVNVTEADTFGFNIVGHTQTAGEAVRLPAIADVDCRRVVYLDDQGNLKYYDTDEDIKEVDRS